MSTRQVDDLGQALALGGVNRSEVTRICPELVQAVRAFRNRSLEEAYPYLWLDAPYQKLRRNHRKVNLAVRGRETGEREILAPDIGVGEGEALWKTVLRGLVQHG